MCPAPSRGRNGLLLQVSGIYGGPEPFMSLLDCMSSCSTYGVARGKENKTKCLNKKILMIKPKGPFISVGILYQSAEMGPSFSCLQRSESSLILALFDI